MSPQMLLGMTQIADAMRISPSGAKQLIDAGRLPPPDAMCGARPMWSQATFDVWFCGYQAGLRSHGKRGWRAAHPDETDGDDAA